MTSQDSVQTSRTFLQRAAGMIALVTFTADFITIGRLVFAILFSRILDYMPASIAQRFAPIGAISKDIGLDTNNWSLFNLGARVLLIVVIFGVATGLYLYFKQDKDDFRTTVYACSWLYMLLANLLIFGASIRFTRSETYTLSQFIAYIVVALVLVILVIWINVLAGRMKWCNYFSLPWMLLLLQQILLLIFASRISMSWMFAGNIVLLLLIGYLVYWFTSGSIDELGVQE